jgi:excisionase family DNA binding protein
LSAELGQSKQQVVTQILTSGLDSGESESAGDSASQPGSSPVAEVLALDQVAILLGVTEEDVEDAVRNANLPGRRIGGQWRFSRTAVLGWLATTDPSIKQRPGFTNRATQ